MIFYIIIIILIILLCYLINKHKCEYFNPEAYGYETHKDISESDRIIFNKSHNDTHMIDNNVNIR
jgi:hypothetical protein